MTSNPMTLIDSSRNPVVFAKDGEVFANSRDVASFFEKRHDNILRDIDALLSTGGSSHLRNLFIERSVYHDQARKDIRTFDMTRDGFMLLAMGFTGEKALRFKLRYIEQFNTMEAEARPIATSGPVIDLNDAGALRGLLLTYSEKAIELEKQVQELLPSQAALERIARSDGSTCITDTAKVLQIRPKDLFAYLRQNGWIYRRAGASYDIAYQSKIISGLLEHKVTVVTTEDGNERETCQVRVTPKGLTKLAQLIKPALEPA